MKSVLLCSYASENSPPEKIERWISELLDYRRAAPLDPKQVETVDLLLSKALSWNTQVQKKQTGGHSRHWPRISREG
jgi:hypothetical protein